MTDPIPPLPASPPPPLASSLEPREIYLAYTSLAIIVAAFVAAVYFPVGTSPAQPPPPPPPGADRR